MLFVMGLTFKETRALDRAATGIGCGSSYISRLSVWLAFYLSLRPLG